MPVTAMAGRGAGAFEEQAPRDHNLAQVKASKGTRFAGRSNVLTWGDGAVAQGSAEETDTTALLSHQAAAMANPPPNPRLARQTH